MVKIVDVVYGEMVVFEYGPNPQPYISLDNSVSWINKQKLMFVYCIIHCMYLLLHIQPRFLVIPCSFILYERHDGRLEILLIVQQWLDIRCKTDGRTANQTHCLYIEMYSMKVKYLNTQLCLHYCCGQLHAGMSSHQESLNVIPAWRSTQYTHQCITNA